MADFNDVGFKIAWGVEGYSDRISRDDDEYVQWIPQLLQKIGEEEQVFDLSFHKCTHEDFDSFYEPNKGAKKAFKTLKSKQTMFCLDK